MVDDALLIILSSDSNEESLSAGTKVLTGGAGGGEAAEAAKPGCISAINVGFASVEANRRAGPAMAGGSVH